jgi:hypothetical protein
MAQISEGTSLLSRNGTILERCIYWGQSLPCFQMLRFPIVLDISRLECLSLRKFVFLVQIGVSRRIGSFSLLAGVFP